MSPSMASPESWLRANVNRCAVFRTRRRLRRMAARATGSRLLDVGYAACPNPYLAAEDRTVVGFDLAEPPSDLAGYSETIQSDVADIRSLLAGREFDTILMGSAIEHIETPYQALRDLHSLLADDGVIILSTPNPLSFPALLFEFLRCKRYYYTQAHLYYFLPRWVERMLQVTGFDVERIVSVGLFLLPVPCPKALSSDLIYVGRKRDVGDRPTESAET